MMLGVLLRSLFIHDFVLYAVEYGPMYVNASLEEKIHINKNVIRI